MLLGKGCPVIRKAANCRGVRGTLSGIFAPVYPGRSDPMNCPNRLHSHGLCGRIAPSEGMILCRESPR